MVRLEQVRSELLERFERIDRRLTQQDQRLTRIDQRTSDASERLALLLDALIASLQRGGGSGPPAS